MVGIQKNFTRSVRSMALATGSLLAALAFAGTALAAPGTVNVTAVSSGTPVTVGYRWLLEEDSTWYVDPSSPGADTNLDTLAFNMHKSHMTVVAQGHSASATAAIPVPDTSKRYFLTLLPDQGPAPPAAALDCGIAGNCYTQSGRQITPELFAVSPSPSLTIALPSQPVPSAQIFARAFQDSAPINGVWENGEQALGGWTVFIYDMGGQMMADTFGHPLGTIYDGDGAVVRLGDGTLHTMTAAEASDPARNPYGLAEGEVLVKGIAPGKYGMRMVPPAGQQWQQTSTIEGTPGLDVWVKANEPRYFAEFGPAGHHAEFGFVTTNASLNDFPKSGDADYSTYFGGGGSISGTVVNQRMSRPPSIGFSGGQPLPGCWVGINDQLGTRGLAVAPCNGDSEFSISGLQPGSYQLVIWDTYLDNIIDTRVVTVPNGNLAMGEVPVFRWFGSHHHYVFNDLNEDGIWQSNERGIPDQAINLRYRDGSLYNSSTTDTAGFLPFDEIFPFFSWLVAEVDFARFKATGVTVVSDAGGPVVPGNLGGVLPPDSEGLLNPQTQAACERLGAVGTPPACTGGNPQARVELAGDGVPPLLEGYNSFLGTTEVFLWGKKAWDPGKNGGITGVIYYQTTRAENDPRFAAPETWEPGIPRVQVALYHADATGRLYHKNPDGTRGAMAGTGSPIVLADVDNYPLDNFPGLEDVNNIPDALGDTELLDLGDAIEVTHSDSWDDLLPEGCRPHQDATGAPVADPFYFGGKCYDALRNYSQVRSAVFDGGYAFGQPFTDTPILPGYYVVQANPPRGADGSEVYQIQQEEDKNVDFGDAMAVSPQALPPACVGGIATDGTLLDNGVAPHDAGQHLTLFSTPEGPIDIEPTMQGQRPGCDFRLVQVTDTKNAATDFFMFTETPITGHITGFVLNDAASEFDPLSPNFGEKAAPSWIPVSVRDYQGNEVYHTYTDKYGTYNAIVPSSFRINTPMPSGVSPNMLQVCLNAATMQDAAGNWVPEPRQNRQYTQFCYTLDFKPGQTTYLDTPVLPISAFAGPSNWQLDCEYPSGTPVIHSASAAGNAGPYVSATNRSLTIYSMGDTDVPDPMAERIDPTTGGGSMQKLVTRDFGFRATGEAQGRIWIGSTEITGANIVSWTNAAITVTVPATVGTGQLRIRRGNGVETVHGLTITVDQPGPGAPPATVVHTVHLGGSIQAAIDAANAGDLIMVEPGTYREMLVMTKPVRLQGWGAASTVVNPVQSPAEKIALWRDKLNSLANCTHEIGLLPGQPNNATGSGPCGFVPGTGLFANEEGAGVLVAPIPGAFGGLPARIDGLTISGADQSGGVVVNAYATGLEISNNIITNNQGPYAAGIRVGQPLLLAEDPDTGAMLPVDADNDDLRIHHNHVAENGGLFEAGAGIGLYTGSERYLVNRNFVCGNNAGGNGAGIAHYGPSNGGRILDNKVLFNQAFDQTVANSGNGGGIFVAGYPDPACADDARVCGSSEGTGTVAIERNLIQGNNAGSGDGGGIAIQQLSTSGSSKLVTVLNNIIVNNVAGLAGGGISIGNATRVSILSNTIANNDSSATAAEAFSSAGSCTAVPAERSCPQIAGVIAYAGSIGSGGFRNNIIIGNRAMHVELAPNSAYTQVVDGFADISPLLYVGGTNGTRNSLLGNTNIIVAPDSSLPPYCSGSNTCLSPAAVEPTHFVRPYWNMAPPFGFGALAAAVDEGGNFIDVHYGPLSLVYCDTAPDKVTGHIGAPAAPPAATPANPACSGTALPGMTERLSDYHLLAGASNAINQADNGSSPTYDVDSQVRDRTTLSNPTISVSNSSFESPDVSNGSQSANDPASWTGDGAGTNAGIYDPNVVPFSGMTGSQVAFSRGGAVLSQTLGSSLVANSDYLLRVDVGDSTSATNGTFAGYRIQLYAGATLLVEDVNTLTPNGTFLTSAIHYVTGATPTAGALQIRLASTDPSTASAYGTYFDNVRLSRTTGNPADRGADEYWATAGGYVPGTTALNNPLNLPPALSIASPLRALAGAAFSGQAIATDPNGDPLQFRLCTATGGSGSCPAHGIPGLSIEPGTGAINWVTPIWTSGPLTLPNCTGTGNTRTCALRVQASDVPFVGGSCNAANCASQSFSIVLRQYDASGPIANNDPSNTAGSNYAVNTMGTFALAAPGVLGNDSSPFNSGSTTYATLTTTSLVDGTTAAGQLTLAADGGFTFIPNTNWVGSTSFTYRASDGVNLSTQPVSNGGIATVTLSRQIAVTSARFIDGDWVFTGLGSINGRRIQIVRDRLNQPLTPAAFGSRPAVTGGTWSFTLTAVPGTDFQPGDTVTVTSTSTAGGANAFSLLAVPVIQGAATDVLSTAHVQCPIDANGDGLISTTEETAGKAMNPPIVCKHLAAADGWSVMADDARTELYTFGFSDVSKVPANEAIAKGILNAQFPAPTLDFDEGDEVYLTLTNAGMLLRPDLFDPHSVHFHGFPNAAAVFDGVPESSITINMGFSYTYYYKIQEPGTFMYHCHVEASEHMQMGMLGNLYVRPKQNGTTIGGYNKFVYNDADGSTGYDVEYPIQIGSFDSNFHIQHIGVQPLPFADMHDDYPMLNGRGYPDTVDTGDLPAAPSKADPEVGVVSGNETSQPMDTRIVIPAGKKALLRISNLNVTRFYTLATTGLPMRIVGTGAHILRGPAGGAAADMYYTTNSVTLGGGEGVDVLIDTTGVTAGTYLLYSTNLEALSNGAEDYGGMMTEIVVQ